MVERPKRMTTTMMVFRVPVIERIDDVEIGSRDVGWCEIHHHRRVFRCTRTSRQFTNDSRVCPLVLQNKRQYVNLFLVIAMIISDCFGKNNSF